MNEKTHNNAPQDEGLDNNNVNNNAHDNVHESANVQDTSVEVTIEANSPEPESEADILRAELSTKQEAGLEAAHVEIRELKEAIMRAKAEVQTIRRRSAQEELRAREKGIDSAVLSVLPAYDDLRRALEAAVADPAALIPGVEQVRDSIKRNLEAIGISEIGVVGEAFNPEFHEALTAIPSEDESKKGTIAQVFESGFVKDGRVVRVARVVVYQD